MKAYLLDNGNWLVPMRAEANGVVGDAMIEVPPDHPEAVKWQTWYRQQGVEPPRKP